MTDLTSMTDMSAPAGPLWRVDRFRVPAGAREALVARLREVHAVLRAQPGCLSEAVIERPLPGGGCELTTLAQWEGAGAMAAAGAVMRAHHAAGGFDPQAALVAMGVSVERGDFVTVG